MGKGGKKKPKTSAALDWIAVALEGLLASRRRTVERELSRSTYGGGNRGPKPKHGGTMSEAVLMKMTPAANAEMAAEAKRLGLASIAEHVRDHHAQTQRGRR